MTTYIIGNGFDIAHNLDTSFESFRKYLEDKQSGILYLFDGTDYWSDFERNICNIDYENFRNVHNMNKGVSGFANSLFEDLCDELVLFLNRNNYRCNRLFKFESDDVFLSFNYTPTLVETYDINTENIYHIHGSLTTKLFGSKSVLILGHDESDYEVNPTLFSSKYEHHYFDFIDYTKKPFMEIMNSKEFVSFMERISKTDRIVVYGVSYGSVDMHYLKHIINNNKTAKIVFYYYSDADYKRLNAFLKENIENLDCEKRCCKGEKYNEKRL